MKGRDVCPVCASRNLDCVDDQGDRQEHRDVMVCLDCGATWTAVYTFDRYEDVIP